MTPMQEHRKRLGLTQSQLAEQVGCTQGQISHLEKKRVQASSELAKRLAAVLGMNVMQILFPEEQQK